jgi:hypothetical protein
VQIAESTVTTLGHSKALTWCQQFRESCAICQISNDRTDRHSQLDVTPSCTELVRAAPRFTIARFVTSGESKVNQGVQARNGHQIHVATSSAVATVRAAVGDELLAAKTHATSAPMPGSNIDDHFVNELHRIGP